ncbi:MAG TPA: hypothetical protein VGA69_05315 [Nitriliruptorales bacterium]
MSDPHTRYEELAVGHVLGGLPQDDATEFRGHLIGCRDCRLRVAELRDIAADLAAAARDEQQRARTKLQTARHPDEGEAAADRTLARARPARRPGALLTVGLVVAVLAAALWGWHLRAVNAELLGASQRQEAVMEAFASGTTVAPTFTGTTRGRVSITQDMVAVTLADVPQPGADRRLVIWLVTGEQATPVLVATRTGPDGLVAWAGERGEADRLLLTLEAWPAPGAHPSPQGAVLVEADLTRAAVQFAPLMGA